MVLVNDYSASASEIVTGALKDSDRAAIIGTRTFGKGLVQSIIPLDDEAALKLTTAVYLTPDGTNINKKGIAPDISVVDRKNTKADEQLQRALAYLARPELGSVAARRDERSRRRGTGDEPGSRGGRKARRPTDAKPQPYCVTRWGKFFSLEPLFADERTYLIAKGSKPVRLDDLVLAVPTRGDRRTVVEVLGTVDDLKAVLRGMLYASGLPQGFPGAVLDEAAAVKGRAERPDHDRRDVTDLPTFTIDPDTARDFDDAISVRREGDGYRAHVHIADVSYFVDEDGALEAAARERTSSVYLPLFAEPMLPPALSSDLCSLVPRAGAQVRDRRVHLRRRRPSQRGAVLPFADPQRPPAHLRLRRHAARSGERWGRRVRRGGSRSRRRRRCPTPRRRPIPRSSPRSGSPPTSPRCCAGAARPAALSRSARSSPSTRSITPAS